MLTYKKALVRQVDTKDCGVTALASIAKFYGSKYSLNHLRELAKTNRDGTTTSGIIAGTTK